MLRGGEEAERFEGGSEGGGGEFDVFSGWRARGGGGEVRGLG